MMVNIVQRFLRVNSTWKPLTVASNVSQNVEVVSGDSTDSDSGCQQAVERTHLDVLEYVLFAEADP
jgi:hypothetical protein